MDRRDLALACIAMMATLLFAGMVVVFLPHLSSAEANSLQNLLYTPLLLRAIR